MTFRFLAYSGVLAFVTCAASAQTATVSLVPPHDSLLPPAFGEWKALTSTPTVSVPEPSMSLVQANKNALEDCGPKRSEVQTFVRNVGGEQRTLHVQAVEFADYTGAFSAYTLIRKPGLRDGKDLGSIDAFGEGAVVFISGGTLVVAFPATTSDLKSLLPLAASFPALHGSQAAPPLLPTFIPEKGLEPGSVRYAVGAATYSAQGGVLPATSIGWDKSAEAITAHYVDKRGDETLTLLLYPTPQIAKAHAKSFAGMLPGLGPKFANAKQRQENEIVMVASGTFSPEAAQQMVDGIHMKLDVTFDKAKPPEFHAEVQKTYSLLTNIMLLSGVLMGAAVLLGLFLGYGRAAVRVMRGKSAAVEPEFLALHLAPQNATPKYDSSHPEA